MDLIVATTSFLPSPGVSSWGSLMGEAAHVALGLSKGLRSLGHRVTLIAPLDVQDAYASLGLARRLSPLSLAIEGPNKERAIHDARLPSGIEVVLLGGEVPNETSDPIERATRVAWFGHAVAAFARQRLGPLPRGGSDSELEAVIAVGEGCGFTALAIRENAKLATKDGGPSPRLLAGLSRIVVPLDPYADYRLPQAKLESIGIMPQLFSPSGIEFYGEVSLAKAGAIAADRIVSLGDIPREALVHPGASHRFDGVYRAREQDLLSIGSGVDQAQYNPATDPHLVARFDSEDLSGKRRGKTAAIAEFELERKVDTPLLVWVSGDAPPAYLAPALDRALRGELLVVVATAAKSSPEARDTFSLLERLAKTHPSRIAVRSSLPEAVLHRALAAADFALVTAEASPSGTAVRAALRYGAIPIALRTPSSEEAIVDIDAQLATGTGFLFDHATDVHAFGAIQRAVSAFGQPSFPQLRRRVMRVEGGWERAARRLESLIRRLET